MGQVLRRKHFFSPVSSLGKSARTIFFSFIFGAVAPKIFFSRFHPQNCREIICFSFSLKKLSTTFFFSFSFKKLPTKNFLFFFFFFFEKLLRRNSFSRFLPQNYLQKFAPVINYRHHWSSTNFETYEPGSRGTWRQPNAFRIVSSRHELLLFSSNVFNLASTNSDEGPPRSNVQNTTYCRSGSILEYSHIQWNCYKVQNRKF